MRLKAEVHIPELVWRAERGSFYRLPNAIPSRGLGILPTLLLDNLLVRNDDVERWSGKPFERKVTKPRS